MATLDGVSRLSDDELLRALHRLVGDNARITAMLVAHLAEVDRRRLHAREAYPSLFAYCTGALHLSEQAAYLRIQAARVSRRCPRVLEALERGELSLSAVKLLDQHLTPDNQAELIRSATHKTVRELELLLAERFPQPDVPTRLRKLPEPRPAPTGGAPSRDARAPARVVPLAPARYKLELTVGQATRDKLRRAEELLRHAVPSGDVEQILSRALDLLIERTEKRRFGAPPKRKEPAAPQSGSVQTESDDVQRAEGHAGEPATNTLPAEAPLSSRSSRHIPASVRRAVHERDGGRCAYVAPDGRRCAARGNLEFHHRTPHARGGPPTVENLELHCRPHNLAQAEGDFGRVRVEHAISRARSLRRSPRRDRTSDDHPAACEALDSSCM